MASATGDLFDRFLEERGHTARGWEQDRNKKQCPECGGLHDVAATECTVCGWDPRTE